MRTYIGPIGYDSTRVTRPILSQGIERDTYINLLVPTSAMDDSRSAQAIDDVRRMIEQIEPTVEIETIRVAFDDFESAIKTCGSTIDSAEGEIIIIFGGGARDIFLPLTIAALSRTNQIHASYQFSDIDGQVRKKNLPDITANISAQTEGTLNTIKNIDTPASLTEVTDNLGVSKSTVTRHVKVLEQQGLLTSETHGKTKIVDITLTGRILVA